MEYKTKFEKAIGYMNKILNRFSIVKINSKKYASALWKGIT